MIKNIFKYTAIFLFAIPMMTIIDAYFYFRRLFDFASESYDKYFNERKDND